MMTLVILIGTVGGVLSFAFLRFPENVIGIALSVAIIAGGVYFSQREEKKARFEIYYRTAQEFGKPLSFGNLDAAFERDGTRIDVDFPKGENSLFFKVNFRVPNLWQKFSIQNRTIATRYDDDCQVMMDSGLPQEYAVQARNPEFLLNLLKNRAVRDEILNYNATFWGRILIAFDDGDFEMIWTPPISEQIDGFYQICQSAAVFHDELKKISRLPR
jgi:hypothetical protein